RKLAQDQPGCPVEDYTSRGQPVIILTMAQRMCTIKKSFQLALYWRVDMQFQYIHWPQNQPVAELYQHEFSRVRELYEYDYRDRNAYTQRAQWLDQSDRRKAASDDVVQALLAYNESAGNHVNALQAV